MGEKNLNRYLIKEYIQMVNKNIKMFNNFIRKLQIKTTMRYHYTPIRMAKIQNTDTTSWRGGGTTENHNYC